jgi:dipeptidyl aminopeptidase/acylaminoacyl peptidase
MKHFVFFLVIGFSFYSFSQAVLTPELLWKLNRVSGGTVSPDGNYLLYSQRSFDMAANKGNTDLFVIDLKNNQSKQITATPFSEMEAQWGKNNTIWFASAEKNGLQIWKMKYDGSEKTQCSNFTDIEFEGFKLSPDESMVLTIEALKLKPTITDKYADLPKANARVEDDLMYRHWDHFDDYKRRHLFLHRISTNGTSEIIQALGTDILQGEIYDGIVPPFGGSDQFCFSNDSKKVLYTSKKMVGKEFAQSTNTAVYEYSIASKETVNLTAAYKGYDNNPAFSASDELAWLSMARDGFEADKNDIILRNLAGIDKNLTKDLDLSVTDFAWHPSGKMIYFLAATKGTVHIFEMDVASGKIRQVTTGQHDYLSISLFGDKVYSGRQSMVAPTDLYAISIKKNKVEQLTEANASILKNLQLPKVEERWMETTDGKQMLVWMVFPPNFDPSKKYPTLLYCQGGPQSALSQFFSYRWNLALMASKGYIVVAPNRRGLPGFGQEWNDAISKDWGGQAMQDYLTAIDRASEEPYVDPSKLGAVGASYGGYSVYMLAGIHENRFKTFVSHCGLFNLESWYGTTEELFFANWDHGGPYWLEENKENYAKFSPHNYVANWNTPILVIHGGMDFRVPEGEGMQAFQAAQLKGIKSKYLYFPTESHWVQSPQNGLVWQREFFEWLDNDLKP